jgi:regulator of replication initiation timing
MTVSPVVASGDEERQLRELRDEAIRLIEKNTRLAQENIERRGKLFSEEVAAAVAPLKEAIDEARRT